MGSECYLGSYLKEEVLPLGERFLQDVIITVYLTVSDLLRPLDFSSLALLDISFKDSCSVTCGSSSLP